MVETGILSSDERVELVRGVVCGMSPKNRAHVLATHHAYQMFRDALRGRASVYMEAPLRLAALDSEPEPDVQICSNTDFDAYGTDNAKPVVVIEVADSSLGHDLENKASLYAEAGIPEYWIVNLVDYELIVFTDPANGSYQQRATLDQRARVSARPWPDASFEVASLFPDERAE